MKSNQNLENNEEELRFGIDELSDVTWSSDLTTI